MKFLEGALPQNVRSGSIIGARSIVKLALLSGLFVYTGVRADHSPFSCAPFAGGALSNLTEGYFPHPQYPNNVGKAGWRVQGERLSGRSDRFNMGRNFISRSYDVPAGANTMLVRFLGGRIRLDPATPGAAGGGIAIFAHDSARIERDSLAGSFWTRAYTQPANYEPRTIASQDFVVPLPTDIRTMRLTVAQLDPWSQIAVETEVEGLGVMFLKIIP